MYIDKVNEKYGEVAILPVDLSKNDNVSLV